MKGTSSSCYHPGVSFEVSFKNSQPLFFSSTLPRKRNPKSGKRAGPFFRRRNAGQIMQIALESKAKEKKLHDSSSILEIGKLFCQQSLHFPSTMHSHNASRKRKKMHNCRTRVKRNYFSLPFPYFYLLLDETGQSF